MKKFYWLIGTIAVLGLIFLFLYQEKPNETKKQIELVLTDEGLNSPVSAMSPDDDSGRFFIVDRLGMIKISGSNEIFLDLRSKIVKLREEFDERGLLGLAFHPNFKENKRFFVYYSAPLRNTAPRGWDHTARISEFTTSDNPNLANPNSEKIVLEIDEPQFNHNGGDLFFDDEGFLYITVGDGGNANDKGLGHSEIGNGQDKTTLLGKILRIDIDNGKPYAIPADNPFKGREVKEEIYAYGLRNPFRVSYDSTTKRIFAADVGQNLWEEVNIIEKGGNYGWNLKEGTACFDPNSPDKSPVECSNTGADGEKLIDPILEYSHSTGISIIGGFVYRGSDMPELKGKYIFGDWSESFSEPKGKIFIAEESRNSWEITETIMVNSFVIGFGEDSNKELYVLTTDTTGPTKNTGKVYKITQKIINNQP